MRYDLNLMAGGMAIGLLACVLPGWGGDTNLTAPTNPPPAATNQPPTAFQAADTNADGKVTSAEMAAAMARNACAKTDKDGDQYVTFAEWQALDRAPGARERFAALDRDQDGKISLLEFHEAVNKMPDLDRVFAGMDKNGDGALAADEYNGLPHFKILSVQF
jgi:Ca2+-binding EF-hand superfamily protein